VFVTLDTLGPIRIDRLELIEPTEKRAPRLGIL
jgi:hypothetical protein